jgi:hypothetical protein
MGRGTQGMRLPPSYLTIPTNKPPMSQPAASAPLVLVDCRPETEEVLKAVFEPRGVVVSRLLHDRGASSNPWIIIRGKANPHLALHAQVIEEPSAVRNSDAKYAELTLPPLFHYGDLIRKVERLLDERRAA